MNTDGFISMLSLADLYFFTENSDGEYTYRFQWSTQAVKGAVDGVFNPNINDYYDDEEEEVDSDYYITKALYDYVSANKNDGTDQADSFIFRIYEKDTGALVKEIATTGKSIDITDLNGEYLWNVTALKDGQVIKTSEKLYFHTYHKKCGLEGGPNGAGDYSESEIYNASSENHAMRQTAFSGHIVQGVITSYGTVASDFFVCGEAGNHGGPRNGKEPYEAAKNGGYLFSISNSHGGIGRGFQTTENCLFSQSGIYVYNNGQWDYVAYNTKVDVAIHCESGNFFALDDDSVTDTATRTLYKYNPESGEIETIATASGTIDLISSNGLYYQSYDGVYRISDNQKVLAQNIDDGEYYLFDDIAVNIYSMFNHTQKCDDLDEGDKGTIKITYSFLDSKTTQTVDIYKSDNLPAEICVDDVYALRVGDYICLQINLESEDYWHGDEDGFCQGISIIHKINGGKAELVSSRTFDDVVISHYLNEDGDIAVSTLRYDAYTGDDYIILEGAVITDTMIGNKYGLIWQKSDLNGNAQIVSVANSLGTLDLQIESDMTGLDFFGLPDGFYQCTRQGIGLTEKNTSSFFVSSSSSESSNFTSDADGNMDVFFANVSGTWGTDYAAGHHGSRNFWSGTGEQVKLYGKNKIADVFSGSSDANILVLTDDANGDALFVEDIYTSFGKDAARFSQINEIRAGAGDDIIDMTSQMYAYDGEEMTIRGGLGDDVIWAVGGDNDLFGDAGNDRIVGSSGFDLIVGGAGNDSMHSGGGNDIFAFCENWGVDTVEITDNAYITLWFASGNASNWDAGKRVYRDGSNSVTVIGGANSTIDLKFGNAGGQYSDMVDIGAFESAASEKIFEDKNNGMLA